MWYARLAIKGPCLGTEHFDAWLCVLFLSVSVMLHVFNMKVTEEGRLESKLRCGAADACV